MWLHRFESRDQAFRIVDEARAILGPLVAAFTEGTTCTVCGSRGPSSTGRRPRHPRVLGPLQ